MTAAGTELKDQGNAEFNNGNFLKAAALYTQAIKADPDNAVLYSNRSAALLKLKKVTKALEDADACIKLKPDWEKGYFRKASVFEEQQAFDKAYEVYQQAQAKWPDNKDLVLKLRSLSKLVKLTEKKEEDTYENFLQRAAGSAAVADFAGEVMTEMISSSIAADGAEFVPSLHFMPGPAADASQEEQRNVRATAAFSAPDTLNQFIGEMRELAQALDAQAMLASIPKVFVQYPQVWTKPGWPCGKQPGVFIHLELKGGASTTWFVPVHDKTPGKPRLLTEAFRPLEHRIIKG